MSQNGKLTKLSSVDAGHRLRADAAASWRRLTAAYGRQIKITDSYRDYESQKRIFLQRYVPQITGSGPYGDVRFWSGTRYVRRSGTAAAAVPGTSNHGWGTALDLADGVNTGAGSTWDWLQANAACFGWRNPAWAKLPEFFEPWHWEYDPTLDRSNSDDWSTMATQEEIRKVVLEAVTEQTRTLVSAVAAKKSGIGGHLIWANGGRYALLTGRGVRVIPKTVFDNYKSIDTPAIKYTNALFDQLVKDWK